MQTRWWGLWLAALLGLSGCRNVCLTLLDACQADPDAGLSPLRERDASVYVPDAGVDAGFPGCVNAGCEDACAGLEDARQVCLYPACVECQRTDGGVGAVFCGRLYTCGRDAGVPSDAGGASSSSSQASSAAGTSAVAPSSSAGSSSQGAPSSSSDGASSSAAAPSSSADAPSSSAGAPSSSDAPSSSSDVLSSSSGAGSSAS